MANLRPRDLPSLSSRCLCLCLISVVAGLWPVPRALGQEGQAGSKPKVETPAPAAATPAQGAPVPGEDEAGSEDLDQIVAGHVRRADEATRRGQHGVAVTELQSAYQMDPQPIFLYRAAQAYHKGGQLKEALAMYRDYVQKDPAGAERPAADAAIRELQLAGPGRDAAPVWKKGWFWAVIGGVAVVGIGLGVGLGLGLRGGGGGMIE
jgi:hypothetical protein